MLKFAIKASIAGSAIYYLKEEGLWRDTEESLKVYDKITTALSPYVEEAKKQLPFEWPQIPNRERSSYVVNQYWNCAVTSTFKFLTELPDNGTRWAEQGLDAIMENPEVKKILQGKPE